MPTFDGSVSVQPGGPSSGHSGVHFGPRSLGASCLEQVRATSLRR